MQTKPSGETYHRLDVPDYQYLVGKDVVFVGSTATDAELLEVLRVGIQLAAYVLRDCPCCESRVRCCCWFCCCGLFVRVWWMAWRIFSHRSFWMMTEQVWHQPAGVSDSLLRLLDPVPPAEARRGTPHHIAPIDLAGGVIGCLVV